MTGRGIMKASGGCDIMHLSCVARYDGVRLGWSGGNGMAVQTQTKERVIDVEAARLARLQEGKQIVEELRKEAQAAGVEEMNMDEIDSIIAECRHQMRQERNGILGLRLALHEGWQPNGRAASEGAIRSLCGAVASPFDGDWHARLLQQLQALPKVHARRNRN